MGGEYIGHRFGVGARSSGRAKARGAVAAVRQGAPTDHQPRGTTAEWRSGGPHLLQTRLPPHLTPLGRRGYGAHTEKWGSGYRAQVYWRSLRQHDLVSVGVVAATVTDVSLALLFYHRAAMDYYEELVEIAAEREEEDECEEVIAGHRRPYTVRTSQDPLQFCSEVEFMERFRLSKQTVIYVVGTSL